MYLEDNFRRQFGEIAVEASHIQSHYYETMGLLNLRSMNLLFVIGILGAVQSTKFGKNAPPQFRVPASEAVDHVNPMIGNGGDSPNGSGGMVPATGPPFAMTRWVAQTRQNYVSVTPYNHTDSLIHGFQATHQPAIWMGESGQVIIAPSLSKGNPRTAFEERGLLFDKSSEITTPSYYAVILKDEFNNEIEVEQSSSSRVGHFRFTFNSRVRSYQPSLVLQATRAYVLGSADPKNLSFPVGNVQIDPLSNEISGRNPERQDHIIGPNKATLFAGYFVARFDTAFSTFGTAVNGTLYPGELAREDSQLSAYVNFPAGT